jgi:hypothetical protein
VAVLVVAISGIAFVAGRWVSGTLDPSAPAQAPRAAAPPSSAPPSAAEPRAMVQAVPSAPARASPSPAPAVARPPGPPLSASPAVVQRVTDEARAQIEAARDRLGERCAPRGPLPDGRGPARLVMSLTFDREGREIARGVTQDRRARSAELAGCLHDLPRLAVTPPAANVGVAIPVTF